MSKKNPIGSRYYFQNDQLGSANVTTNFSGALVESTTYDPWGTIQTGGTKSKFLYTGQENDTETGLDYYNARYYSPTVRRFTQPDSFTQNIYDPQDLNEYSYVKNNPMTYNDPTGHCSVVCFLAGSLSLAGLEIKGAVQGAITSSNTSFMGRVQGAIVGAQNAAESNAGQISMGVATLGLTMPVEGEMIANNTEKNSAMDASKTNLSKDIPTTVNGFELGAHAIQRMDERNISLETVRSIIKNGDSFNYFHEGVSKVGFYDKDSSTFVGTVNNKVSTVINNVDTNYIENLKKLKP